MSVTPELQTLFIVYISGRILLGKKKRGFGKDRWNGFGGKLQPQESIKSAVMREIKEEVNIVPKVPQKRAVITFLNVPGSPLPIEVHVFSAHTFDGEPQESEEMLPRWFPFSKIPYKKMWPDDRLWLPLILAGKHFRATFTFGVNDSIASYSIVECNKSSF